ncbi:MAG: TSUP family transporter [Sporomusaceae bacterium]|nr:TSUP family transporter [Sporomusaceae bacterium]
MEPITLSMGIFLFVVGFVASFIDSVVGGGGLVTLPALLMTGLPITHVFGTNKMAASMGSITSMTSFIRSGKVDLSLVKWLFPLALVGSGLGAFTVQFIPSTFLKPLVIVLLIVVAIYTVFKKDWGDISTYQGLSSKRMGLSGLVAFCIGFYDGFFGPGTGSFLIFAFLLIGFDFVTSSGNAKVLNFASNIAALITFLVLGYVHYDYGLVMGIGMILGAIAGTKVAILKGAAYVRPLFISITVILVGKQIWDILLS